jgi:TRAP-type uncharacterized transport system fused permease subunit
VRKLTGYAAAVLGVVAVVMSLYHVYARLTPAAPDTLVLRIIVLAFCLTLSFLLFPFRSTTPLDEESTRIDAGTAAPTSIPWIDLGLAALSIAGCGYLFIYYGYVTERFPTRIRSARPISWWRR